MKRDTEDTLTIGCALMLLAACLALFGVGVWAVIELVKWVTSK